MHLISILKSGPYVNVLMMFLLICIMWNDHCDVGNMILFTWWALNPAIGSWMRGKISKVSKTVLEQWRRTHTEPWKHCYFSRYVFQNCCLRDSILGFGTGSFVITWHQLPYYHILPYITLYYHIFCHNMGLLFHKLLEAGPWAGWTPWCWPKSSEDTLQETTEDSARAFVSNDRGDMKQI